MTDRALQQQQLDEFLPSATLQAASSQTEQT